MHSIDRLHLVIVKSRNPRRLDRMSNIDDRANIEKRYPLSTYPSDISDEAGIPEYQRIVFHGPLGWHSREIGSDTIIGRDLFLGLSSEISSYISRKQFLVFTRDGYWWIRAFPESTNSTFIDDRVLRSEAKLNPGMTIGIGNPKTHNIPVCLSVSLGVDVSTRTMSIIGKYIADFQWTYSGTIYRLAWPINKEARSFFKAAEFHTIKNTQYYDHYIRNDPWIDQIRDLTTKVLECVENKSGLLSSSERALLLLRFVQSLEYISDGGIEWPRYPYETILEGGGDCEDVSLLYMAMLAAVGIPSALLHFKGHVAIGVEDVDGSFHGTYWYEEGKKYFFCETTGFGFDIGEMSSKSKLNGLYPMFGGILPKSSPGRILGCTLEFVGDELVFNIAVDLSERLVGRCDIRIHFLDKNNRYIGGNIAKFSDSRGLACISRPLPHRGSRTTTTSVSVSAPCDALARGGFRKQHYRACGSITFDGVIVGESRCLAEFWLSRSIF